jgi:hypothetical protein
MKKLLCIALVASGVFADECGRKSEPPVCFDRGFPLTSDNPKDGPCPAAYNIPAAIEVRRSWDVTFNASFIYWYYGQDEMDIASIQPDVVTGTDGNVFYPAYGYRPGFKVGVGCNPRFDDWTLDGVYTWFHNSKGTTIYSADKNLVPSDMVAGYPSDEPTFGQVHSNWLLHMEYADVTASRPFYLGKNLTVSPKGGLRGLWIRQHIRSTFTEPDSGDNPLVGTASSNCWSVGPMGAVQSNWLVWKYIRFQGWMGSSVLYTRYTSVKNSAELPLEGLSTSSQLSKFSTLRPTMEAGLGMGAGGYLGDHRYYLDFSANYDFLFLWSQNVMRSFASQLDSRDDGIGDLFFHGLTATLRFDF